MEGFSCHVWMVHHSHVSDRDVKMLQLYSHWAFVNVKHPHKLCALVVVVCLCVALSASAVPEHLGCMYWLFVLAGLGCVLLYFSSWG